MIGLTTERIVEGRVASPVWWRDGKLAAEQPAYLGYWLCRLSLPDLCQRLGCDVATALRLQAFPTPHGERWLDEAVAIALSTGIEPERLAAVLAAVGVGG